MNFRCSRCGAPVHPKTFQVSPKSEILCFKCFGSLYFKCAGCGDKLPVKQKHTVDGQNVCKICLQWMKEESSQ